MPYTSHGTCGLLGDDNRAVALTRVVGKVVLVVLLRREELLKFGHFRDDRVPVQLLRRDFVNHLLGNRLLFRAVVEDGGAILRSRIRALSVERCRVMRCEEQRAEYRRRK